MREMKKLIGLLAMAGMSAFTLAADEPQGWTYYAADDAENPFSGEGIGCLSNETWMLCANIRSAASNTLIVSPRNEHENAFDIWVGTMLQQKSRTLLFLAFYGLSVLCQETDCKF